ncbi:unnamed protein product [Effrenium voratum]|uniref:FHA domain-containing protein n=1 Tax=Effrenium voratum TaxID=2562239 RepID=A0AA36JMW3_9DINO|nr:unnamed protein product [Effrenium voratum]
MEPAHELRASCSVTIGRRPTNTLVCNDISVSGKHCELLIEDGTLRVSDWSTNGTYINDERISKGDAAVLRVGDVLSLTKPHPPGAQDGTVEPPPPRVQFRVSEGLESFSPAPKPPARAATTAEGFAHDLLMQEQQCKAKITGELLLARRRLDEERSKSEAMTRDLRKAKAALDEERRRRGGAAEARDALRAEVGRLKDCRHQLPEMRSTQESLQQKHEALEIELTTQAQKACALESAVQRLREELEELQGTSGSNQLETAQETLRQAQEEAARLELSVAEAQKRAEGGQKEVERLQQELSAERARKERLEDRQALLSGELDRAGRGGASGQELLAKARQEIQGLEERVARCRGEAETQRGLSASARARQQEALKSAEQLREACVRFAEAVQNCTEKWVQGLDETPAAAPKEEKAAAAQTKGAEAPAVAIATAVATATAVANAAAAGANAAAAGANAAAAGANAAADRANVGAEVVDTAASQASSPSQPPPVPPPESSPEGARPAPAQMNPQRQWSVAVLGGTAEADSLGVLLDSPSSKRRRVSVH